MANTNRTKGKSTKKKIMRRGTAANKKKAA